jgi:DNA-binding LacI/PurR family transcriptional regulator
MSDSYVTLAERIRTGFYTDGSRLPTERALAEELGVARSTLRRTLDRLAGDGLLDCRPGCRPIVRSGGAKPAALKAVALLMGSESVYQPFNQILRGCEAELRKAGYLLVYLDTWAETLRTAEERMGREREALESLSHHPVAGIVIWSQEPEASRPLLEGMRGRGQAVVTLDREVEGLPVDHVGVENYHSARAAVEHLVSLGHRRIGFVSTPVEDNISTIAARRRAFTDTLHRHGLPAGPDAFFGFPRYASDSVMAQILRPRTDSGNFPTAFFTMNDLYALRLVGALRLLGLRVPEDASVAGFDDVESGLFGSPFLTTVRQPFMEIGRTAAQVMLQRLEEPAMPVRHVFLGTELVRRQSAGAAPSCPAASERPASPLQRDYSGLPASALRSA